MIYRFDSAAFGTAVKQSRGNDTLREFAGKVRATTGQDVHFTTIGRIENGSTPDASIIGTLCTFMRRDPGEFYAAHFLLAEIEELRERITQLEARR